MRLGLFFLAGALALAAAPTPSGWLDKVAPILTAAERKTYLALPVGDRRKFEDDFWATRTITPEEYYRRLDHVDSMWGAGKTGSGANTDPGRVYLALGSPTRVTRLPSSRTFVPLEIWYYDAVPGVILSELRLLFFRPNSMGLPKLYSPEVDTIRALLVPQSATVHAFGPNESLKESDVRRVLKTGPGEDEVITASAGVASGIKGTGNQEILAMVASPETLLLRSLKTKVTARLLATRAQMDTVVTPSPFGGRQVDLRFRASAANEIRMEILDGDLPLVQNKVVLGLGTAKSVEYSHRVDLLPGRYQVVFTADGASSIFPLEIAERPAMGEIVRADTLPDATRSPFVFEGRHYDLDSDGRYGLVALGQPSKVAWMLRKGSQVVWRTSTDSKEIAVVELPSTLAPGEYRLEAVAGNESKAMAYMVRNRKDEPRTPPTAISYNANLAPAMRYAFVGRQLVGAGRLVEARKALESSLSQGRSADAAVTLARVDALEGNLDAARDRIRNVIASNPNDFEALSVYAYIETRFQDYAVAAQLYRRALEVQDSPAVRAALANLPNTATGR